MSTPCIDETSLTLFVENRLDEPAAKLAIEQHIDTCATCRSLVGQLASGATLVQGTRIDRYVMISPLGAGGMGRVYLCSDPELDRQVAIKVLRHVDAHGEYDARLRREAQGLARVTHRNVAAIYDVGEIDDHLFLAMEYVAGGTLSAWLTARPRTWRDVVRVFAGAARGLAAVHARGLVHRDFKPENVLLDEHGDAKVTDFGLVATLPRRGIRPSQGALVLRTRGDLPSGLEERTEGIPDQIPAFAALTATGIVLGTPAYMAPEQFQAGNVDARSDQFSFCVALFEALYGERPFSGTSVAELKASLASPPREPQRRGVPRWLHRVAMRGLALDPAARFASMDEIAIALDRGRRARRGTAIVAAAAAAIVLGAVLIAVRMPAETSCATGDLETVWNPRTRDALRGSLAAGGAPFAKDAATSVVTQIDHYADRWRAEYTQVCQATHVHHTQSVQMMDRRMTCLSAREHELASLIEVLEMASPAIKEHAVDLATSLPPIERCTDIAALSAPMSDPAARRELDQAHGQRERAEAEIDSGLFDQAAPIVDELAATADRLHDASLEVEVQLLRAHLQGAQGKVDDATATYQRVIAAADRSRNDFQRAWAWAKLVGALAAAGKLAEAEAQLPLAQAAVDRAGSVADLAQLWDLARGTLYGLRGNLAEASRIYEAALARARARNDRRDVADLLHELAITQNNVSDPAHALELETESAAIATQLYGPRHPQVAMREREIAHMLSLQGKDEEALAKIQDAYEILRGAYGAEHYATAVAENTLAIMQRRLGKLDDSRRHTLHAIEVLDARHDAYQHLSDALRNMALLERAAKAPEKALAYQKQAHALLEQHLGPETDGLIGSFHSLAEIYQDLGNKAEEEAALRSGLALGERTAPDNPQLGLFYAELGTLRLAAHDARGAEQWLERAVKQMSGSSVKSTDLAYARLDLAHAKVALGKRGEAHDLAVAAKADLDAPEDLAEAEKVMASTRR